MDRERELDRVKAAAFLDSNAAFLGCLMCNLSFKWDTNIETAGINDTSFRWNPDWFDSLSDEERKGVLMHELWHLALLHGSRMNNREPERWNAACDYKINANLKKDGYTLPKDILYSEEYADEKWIEEEIYNDLPPNPNQQGWGSAVTTCTPNQVAAVQSAVVTAKMAGNTPGSVEQLLKDFLKPKLPWKTLLHKYLLNKINPDWSWKRPNRRFSEVYMPSFLPEDGQLTSVVMFLDTSGSIDPEDIKRFLSEAKYVQEHLRPELLTLIQFDTEIQSIKTYKEGQRITHFDIKGFGGTDYSEIREYILKHKPTVSIIFTDLYAHPMEPVDKLNVVWVIKNNQDKPPFGESVYVD